MKLHATASLLALALMAPPVLADAPAGAPADTPADAVALKQTGRWAQDYTRRPADPAIRFGTLPNGLRYAIARNQTPSDGVAMRMRIGSGSLAERDDEQGLAHFLEHMAFRGSSNIADGQVVHMLERQGLRFGPDTNAFTAHDQTVYMFTFPTADATALDTGFTLFREIGERLTLAQAAIDAEKGVVLSEERLRDNPPYRATKANFGNALAGTRAVSRWPIGLVDTIKGATSQRLRRYYAANYRPDNATIIVIGNIDPAQVEREINARFSNWKPAAPGEAVDPGTPVPAHAAAEFVTSGAQDSVTLSWVRPLDRRAETEAVDREMLLRWLALTILDNRLADRAGKPGSPYVGSQTAELSSLFGAASLTQIQIVGAPGTWRAALDAVTGEQRQLLEQGASSAELQRASTQILTRLQLAAANAPTRKSSDIADALVQSVNDDQIATSPAQDLASARQLLATVDVAAVNTALHQTFAGKGPVLFRSAQADPITVPVLEQALAADYAKPVAPRVAEAAIAWPYTDFGPASQILTRTRDQALGATTVTFANGTRLIVKSTSFEKDTVQVSVALGNGRKGAAADAVHALWAVQLATLGGTGKLAISDITRWAQTSGKAINMAMSADADAGAFTLLGQTRPADLASELQLLAAFTRDPGFRPELGDKIAAVAPMFSGQIDANPGSVFLREFDRLTGGGDSRYGVLPTTADVTATRASDLAALLRPALAGAADVTIVGDIPVEDAVRAVQATFGSGPARPRPSVPATHVTMAPARIKPYAAPHTGRADQAYYGEVWAIPDYFTDPSLGYTADVAAAVLQARLVDTVREKMGLTYSPQAQALSSLQLPGRGYFAAMLETPPASFEAFRALLTREIGDLAGKPVSGDELERAKQPLIASRVKDLETNAYWLGQLPMVLRDPRIKAPTLEQVSGIRAVTASRVQSLIRQFVEGRTPVTIAVKAR